MHSALALLAALASAAPGQRVAARELSLGAVATTSGGRGDFIGVGLGIARRPGAQGRLALSLAAGRRERAGGAAVRLEATAQFVLNPGARSGAALYAAGGAAYAGARRRRGAAYLVAWLGLEGGGAWAARGWYAELGLGGGVRWALGLRWRRWRR